MAKFPHLSFCSGLLLTSLFVMTSCMRDSSGDDTSALYERKVEGNVFDTMPVRGPVRPMRLRRGGFDYLCSECHSDLENLDDLHQNNPQGEHRGIVFDHGQNLYCLNCHHPENRDVFAGQAGEEISDLDPTRLCAKCHGPHHREWEHGVHGRRNGHWDTELGGQSRLECVRCHDPHKPRFQLMAPDAPPFRSRFRLEGKHHEEREGHEAHEG